MPHGETEYEYGSFIHSFIHSVIHSFIRYFAPVGERSIAISLSVCVSVCPRAYLWNRWTDLHDLFVQIPCRRGSVLLWRRCNMLCTSGFMDDVRFGRNGPYGDAWKAEPLTYYTISVRYGAEFNV